MLRPRPICTSSPRPAEFQNRPTFNPPVGYLLMMPLQLLLPTARLTLQAGLALGDALGCLFLLLLARELGLPRARPGCWRWRSTWRCRST